MVGAVIGTGVLGVGYNRVNPIVPKNSIVYGAKAHEIVVGSSGINVNLAGTVLLNDKGTQK